MRSDYFLIFHFLLFISDLHKDSCLRRNDGECVSNFKEQEFCSSLESYRHIPHKAGRLFIIVVVANAHGYANANNGKRVGVYEI